MPEQNGRLIGADLHDFGKLWDSFTYAKKTRLLVAAGDSKHHASRCWQYTPHAVKQDVEYIHRMQQLKAAA